jgi:hypothetical protein
MEDLIARRAVADDAERVQMGAPLSAAEKLQAIPGALTTWLNELLKKYVLEEDTLTENMDWDVSRGKPFQNVASMTYMCWYTDSRKAVSSPDLKKWLLKSVEVSPCLLFALASRLTVQLDDLFKKRMETVLSIMIRISKYYKSITFDVPGIKKAPRVAPVGESFYSMACQCIH